MSRKALAHMVLLFVAVAYGANYIIAKGLMPHKIGPSGFIAIRVIGATLLFWLLYSRNREKIAKEDWLRLIICGLTGVAINQLMFFNGLSLTSPINASIIMTSNPILVLVAAAIILKQKITGRKVLGIAFGAVGAIGLLILGAQSMDLHSSPLGDLMILINALSYGIYLVTVKPLMAKYKPLTVVTYVFSIGLLFVLPIGWNQMQSVEWSQFNTADYASLAYVVLIVTFLVYLLNIFALKHVQPTTVSAYIYLQPLTAGITAAIAAWLGTSDYISDITWPKVGCAILIFLGVYLVSSKGMLLSNKTYRNDA